MNGLDFNKAPSCLPTKRLGDKSSRVRKSEPRCCNVKPIIGTMLEEQKEHLFSKFGEAYYRDRKVVTSWMMDVCEYFSLHPTTIHGAIAYLDRLQPSDKHSRYEWKMFVVCCILISSKYNESEADVPDLETLEYLIQLPIPKETLLNYELWTLQKLGWKLNVRTPLAFIACYVVCGVSYPTDICWDSNRRALLTSTELDTRISDECYAMASFALLEAHLKPHKASDIACAILYFVRRALGVVPIWNSELTALTRTDPTNEAVMVVLSAFESLLLQPVTVPSSSQDRSPNKASPSHSSSSSSPSHSSSNSVNSNSVNITTPIMKSRSSHDIDALSTLVSSATINDTEPLAICTEGINTPEDKENMKKGIEYPSPMSVIAMDSLENVM